MAAVFSIGIASSLVLALGHSSVVVRLGFLAVGCTGLLCVFLTHNRSGVLGPLAVIAVYALISPRFRGVRRIGMLIASVVIGMCLLLFIVRFYPDHASVYVAKLGFLGLAEKTWESDHLRIDLFIAAIKAMGSTPLGHGFSLVKLPSGITMDAHNVVTAIIWAAGVFSLVWLPIFAATVYGYFGPRLSVRRGSRPPIPIEYDAVACALFSWLASGMTHNIMQTGVAWLLFGVLISNRYFSSRSSIQSASASKATRAGRDTDTRISNFGSPATGGG